MTTRELKLVYFDGNSAANLDSGTYDTMDLLLWGKVRPEMVWREWDRAKEACEWGSKWGFDGFVRMEMDLCVFGLFVLFFLLLLEGGLHGHACCSEIIMCDFSKGLELVNTHDLSESIKTHSLRIL